MYLTQLGSKMTRMKHEIHTCLGFKEGLSSVCALPLESVEDESAGGEGCKVRAGEMAFSFSSLSFFYPPQAVTILESRHQTENTSSEGLKLDKM